MYRQLGPYARWASDQLRGWFLILLRDARRPLLLPLCPLVQSFVRAAEKFGRTEIEKIAGEMEGKSREEVERYSKVRWPLQPSTLISALERVDCCRTTTLLFCVGWCIMDHLAFLVLTRHAFDSALHQVFWARHQELSDWEKYIKNIERGEQKIQRQQDIMQAIRAKLEKYKNPWQELKVSSSGGQVLSTAQTSDDSSTCSIPSFLC